MGRDFTAPTVNQRYVGDITYLPVGERGFLYLATVIDLHSRRPAGYAIAGHMRTELVLDALTAAQRTRDSLHGAILHIDHAGQYTSWAFAAACHAAGVQQSMSPIGSSADNAAAESFNASLKRETLLRAGFMLHFRDPQPSFSSASSRVMTRPGGFSSRLAFVSAAVSIEFCHWLSSARPWMTRASPS